MPDTCPQTSTAMNLVGKTRDQIARACAGLGREELIDQLAAMALVEQYFSPSRIASLSDMSRRTVIRDIHAGRFNAEYFVRSGNQIRVSATGVNKWRASMRVCVAAREAA